MITALEPKFFICTAVKVKLAVVRHDLTYCMPIDQKTNEEVPQRDRVNRHYIGLQKKADACVYVEMENLVPQADGLYALTFKNFQKVTDDEVRELFEEYGDIASIRKSSASVPWVFVRYRTKDEALKAYRGLQNCDRFDIRVATGGKKAMEGSKGSDEKEKGAKGEPRDEETPKGNRERSNFESDSLHESADSGPRNKNSSRFSGHRERNDFVNNSFPERNKDSSRYSGHKERSEFERNSLQERADSGPRNKDSSRFSGFRERSDFECNSPLESADSMPRNRDSSRLSAVGGSRKFTSHSPKKLDDMEGKRNLTKRVQKYANSVSDSWEDYDDAETVTDSLSQLSVHGNVRHRKGMGIDEVDAEQYDGPPKLVRATELYGAYTVQHPYESVLASRAVFKEIWNNHPLREMMELHEVVIANFDAVPTENDIRRLCSRVNLLHVSIEVTPKQMPYCRVLVATEEDAEKLYMLDGRYFNGLQLYVSSMGYMLDQLAE